MKTVEQFISPLVKSHFPEFFKDQGPLFVLFVEEYYRWLEENNPDYSTYDEAELVGNALYHTRKLVDYKDIDNTVDDFLIYFNEKYLKGVKSNVAVSKRKLIKAAQDIFSAKGSDRSLDLFFKLIYGTKIEIYRPGEDILKPSDGTWVSPLYLELSPSSRTVSYVGKQVTGSISGARAFIEYVITRNVNGKIIDVAFLSNLRGTFVTGEYIFDDGIIENAPIVTGSLTNIDITLGGQGFTVGEIVSLVSSRGTEGRARISSIDTVTGVVTFTIIDGGWGYTNSALSLVSSRVISVSNVYNTNTSITGFTTFETVSQNLYNFSLNNVTGILQSGLEFNNNDGVTPSVSISTLIQQTTTFAGSNTANIVLNQIQANVFSNTILFEKNRSIVTTNNQVLFTLGSLVVQYSGSSNNTTGVIGDVNSVFAIKANTSTISSNGIHVGTYVEQSNTLATGFISTVTRESNFTFTNVSHLSVNSFSGSFNNTDTINIYSDSSKANSLGSFVPEYCVLGYQYLLVDTNLNSNTRWSTGNTIIDVVDPLVNTTIIVASDVGGIATSCTDVTATANLIGSNSSSIGVISVLNAFYANNRTQIIGRGSNTVANTVQIFSGTGAGFSVGTLSDAETLRLSDVRFVSNNDGPGSNSTQFINILLSGANATFGNLSSVYVIDSGTGYDNTNIVTFSGGNSGAGSFTSGNATITTDASGNIVFVTLSANTGNGIVSTPSTQIVNSTGGSTGVGSSANIVPLSSLGFVKFPAGDLSDRILDLIEFEDFSVGTISALKNINPGENYSAVPFVVVYDPVVSAYGKRDFLLEISSNNGINFITGEVVEQTSNISSLQITSNNFSGNVSGIYEVNELVYSTDGISNTATGIIYSSTIDIGSNSYITVLSSNTGTWQNTIAVSILTVSTNTDFNVGNFIEQGTANGILVTSNSTTLIVKDVNGTFQVNATPVTSNSSGSASITGEANSKIYTMIGLTSNGVTDVVNTGLTSFSIVSKGIVKAGSNSTFLPVRRTSLLLDFSTGAQITGRTSSAIANIVSVSEDSNSQVSGLNANISANVTFAQGSILSANVINSGFGYENDETITLLSSDGLRSATAKANVSLNGAGEGFYSSTRGFLDSSKYIHDGEYYQNYSYEIQTGIPFEEYFDTLKATLHIAGKKMFGRVVKAPQANLNITGTTTIDIA